MKQEKHHSLFGRDHGQFQRLFSAVTLIYLMVAVVEGFQRFGNNTNEEEARQFLNDYNDQMNKLANKLIEAQWNYETNVKPETRNSMIEAEVKESAYLKEAWSKATSFAWTTFQDENIRRQFQLLSVIGSAALQQDDFTELTTVIANMTEKYSMTVVCPLKEHHICNLQLDPGLTEIMASSANYDELLYYWKEWHDRSGRHLRDNFARYVNLKEKAAKLNGFNSTPDLWLNYYEVENFEQNVEAAWLQIKPLYKQIHAYVRRKLMKVYKNKIRSDGPIPAHILGNMWAQDWTNIAKYAIPFPEKPIPSVTDALEKQAYTPIRMFRQAESFFESLGFKRMPPSFWELSMFERPAGKEVVCHASAWDFFGQKDDVRIKMCAMISMHDFIVVHHEMGHIQYYLQYKDQPIIFRDGANPGFHEAIGDTILLSASSISHLRQMRLWPDNEDDDETDINYLFLSALRKLIFIPFGYVTDLWRWKVFRGEISKDEYNSKWWELRKTYQGIEPGVKRTDKDFDPGAKFHIVNDVEYMRYFVSHILQFQFHKALCVEAGEYVPENPEKPLYKCDIYHSKEAGKLLREMMQLGSSKPWTEAMKIITKGKSASMDTSAILEYFKPLEDFLRRENEKNNEYIGWRDITDVKTEPNSLKASLETEILVHGTSAPRTSIPGSSPQAKYSIILLVFNFVLIKIIR